MGRRSAGLPPVERWRGRVRARYADRGAGVRSYGSYLRALVAGVALVLAALLVAADAHSRRPLEIACGAVALGAAVVAVVFIWAPMQHRDRNAYLDSVSDRPAGEYHETTMDVGMTVTLHALAFAAPSIAALAFLFFTSY